MTTMSKKTRDIPRYCDKCGLGLATLQTTETCPRCHPPEPMMYPEQRAIIAYMDANNIGAIAVSGAYRFKETFRDVTNKHVADAAIRQNPTLAAFVADWMAK